MPSISRQYHPPSCSLEITAQTSPLSRWSRRPILRSVNFLLSFQGIAGQNHEPLEIRGDRQQLEMLADTVTQYVQSLLGQSLSTSVFDALAPIPGSQSDSLSTSHPQSSDPPLVSAASEPLLHAVAKESKVVPSLATHRLSSTTSNEHPPYLRTHSLLTHDLVLGSLVTNAENQTVPLKTSQLFDLVSALDDCATELEMLPLPTPTRRPIIPVWASSAAVVILTLGVTTATLRITQQTPSDPNDLVTTADRDQEQPPVPTADFDGVASVPSASSTPKSKSPSSSSKASPSPSPTDVPAPANTTQASPEREETGSAPLIALEPPQEQERQTLTQPSPSKPPDASAPKQQTPKTNTQNQDQETIALADKPGQRPRMPPPKAEEKLQPEISNRPYVKPELLPSSSADAPVASEPSGDADTFAETDRLQDEKLDQNQIDPAAPSTTTLSRTRALTPEAIEIRQYISQRWQAPASLSQSLEYQLILSANGSLKRVNPLNQEASQYLGQVPLPAVNKPFITPLKSSPSVPVRLVLKPDGTVQTFVDTQSDAAQ